MKDQIRLRWYHFLISWLACLATGLVLMVVFGSLISGASDTPKMSLAVSAVALMCSAPFIVVFCIVMHFFVLRKPRSKSQIHLLTFLLHAFGSLLVFIIMLYFSSELGFFLVALIAGYFAIDSFYFHLFIHRKANPVNYEKTPDADLLDQQIDI